MRQMKRHRWTIWGIGLAMVLALTACKEDKAPAPRAKKRVKTVPRAPAKRPLFDPGAYARALALPAKKLPIFGKIKQQLPQVAKTCKKKKKYLSSFTWCSDWKSFVKTFKPALKAVNRKNPATIQKALAIALAGVAHLRDPELFVRFAGLQVLEQVMYNLAWKRVRRYRPLLVRVIANRIKNGTKYDERKQALRLLGNDGGTARFHGTVYDGKVLAWAAHKDKSKWVRRAALGHLPKCLKKLKGRCPVTPAKLKTWMAKETDGTAKEGIARLAGMLGMSEEVFAWCSPRLLESKLYWGCRDAFKYVLKAEHFERFEALARKFMQSEKSKSNNNFRMAFVVKLMLHGLKKQGFPKEKVKAFLLDLLKQAATADKRSRNTTIYAVQGLSEMAEGKKELKATRKQLRRLKRAYTRKWRKNKSRKEWLKRKIFSKEIKKLKEKIKQAG